MTDLSTTPPTVQHLIRAFVVYHRTTEEAALVWWKTARKIPMQPSAPGTVNLFTALQSEPDEEIAAQRVAEFLSANSAGWRRALEDTKSHAANSGMMEQFQEDTNDGKRI